VLSFTRERERSALLGSTGSSRSEQLAEIIKAEREAQLAQLTEMQRMHDAEMRLREQDSIADAEKRRALLELERQRLEHRDAEITIERQKAQNEARALELRSQELEQQRIQIQMLQQILLEFLPK